VEQVEGKEGKRGRGALSSSFVPGSLWSGPKKYAATEGWGDRKGGRKKKVPIKSRSY